MALRRYAPLGRCMYCLATGVRLTEEHLIPKSLGGRLTLRDAVCEPCRVRTGSLEQLTLDRDFAIPKTLLAMKRRRARKKGPRRLPAFDAPADAAASSLAAEAAASPSAACYPRTFTLPAFARAGLLAAEDRATTPPRIDFVVCRLQIGTVRNEIAAPRRMLADPFAFGYSIAKWAYGLAVAERGLACCDTRAIRQLLSGERCDVFNFVGSCEASEPGQRGSLHSVTLRERDGWLAVLVHVLGSAGMRPYEVAIGRLPTDAA